MASDLGLNDHHRATVLNYMRFARYQRSQRLRAVDACFDDLKESRLTEDTFTADEVNEMLVGLHSLVKGEVESELINTSHTNVLLLRQLFQQAEKWHLKLQADISDLENRELLEKIADFEEAEFSGTKRDSDLAGVKSLKLEPLNDSGGAAGLLHMRIDELQEENNRLRDRLRASEQQASGALADRGTLSDDVRFLQDELKRATSKKSGADPEEVEQLKERIAQLKAGMEGDLRTASRRADGVQTELVDTKHELLRVKEMLEMAEKELEKKVSGTAPFKNLKVMLQKKNDQLKDFRKRLSKYEPVADE